jgi:restriction endonuclease Mrr
MLSIMVTILRQRTSYNLKFEGATNHAKNSAYHDLTAQVVSEQLQELRHHSDDEIKKIIDGVTTLMSYQQYYPVDAATYERVLG